MLLIVLAIVITIVKVFQTLTLLCFVLLRLNFVIFNFNIVFEKYSKESENLVRIKMLASFGITSTIAYIYFKNRFHCPIYLNFHL